MKLVVNVEYTLKVSDENAAAILAELATDKGLTFGSENHSIYDFNPTETVVSAVVVED